MNEEYNRQLEALKLYFEAYKHLATLSVATPVLVLAIFRDFLPGLRVVALIVLLLFGLSLFVSLGGMYLVLTTLRAPTLQFMGVWFERIFYLAGAVFFGGGLALLLMELLKSAI